MIYGNLPHVAEDLRPTVCYRNGGILCACGTTGRPAWETPGWCNQQKRYPYDGGWEKEKEILEELLKAE